MLTKISKDLKVASYISETMELKNSYTKVGLQSL